MPRFVQNKQAPTHAIKAVDDIGVINIRFETEADLTSFNEIIGFEFTTDDKSFRIESRKWLAEKLGQKITDKTKSMWHPFKSHWGGITEKYISCLPIKSRYPVYIVSKGRSKNGLTWKALDKMGVGFKVIVEQSELEDYAKVVGLGRCLVLPQEFLDKYDTCDDLGDSKSKGPGAARNFAMQHSRTWGAKRHWVLDDNLDAFHYLTDNEKFEVECSSTFAAAEDFVDRYSNIPVAGMNYYSFCKKTDRVPPLKFNTRIYSCLLIDNYAGYDWRGRYNEDTDLSLRVLKDGLCTVQFNAFLCGKVTTQRMAGGNSKEFYSGEGTLPKSQMLADLHPDVSKVVWRFNRWHHHVDYKVFESNEPIITSSVDDNENNYGLVKILK